MTGTLVFKLPEEREAFKIAQSAESYLLVLTHVDSFLRNKLKHEECSQEQADAYAEVRAELRTLLTSYDLCL
jgi:ribonuclease BN (tRNA processing enzyme)